MGADCREHDQLTLLVLAYINGFFRQSSSPAIALFDCDQFLRGESQILKFIYFPNIGPGFFSGAGKNGMKRKPHQWNCQQCTNGCTASSQQTRKKGSAIWFDGWLLGQRFKRWHQV